MPSVTNLRCEYLSNPLGIDIIQPRLSWELRDPRRGARQLAYQIIAARSAAALADGQGELWDSGRVESDATTQIAYAGPQLTSGERVWWQVRVWNDEDTASEWSEAAWWEMGLLEASDWQARWIAGPLFGGARATIPVPFLRRSFTLSGEVRWARLYITALGVYEAQINGQRVGEDIFAPGWTDYKQRVQYQVYDVASLLQPGSNAIGAILGDGWYSGNVAWDGRQHYGERPQLFAQLVVELADGSRQTIVSDDQWQVAYGPIIESDMQAGESYDARRELLGWSSANYDPNTWQAVSVVPAPTIALTAMRGPAVRRIQELQPVGEPTQLHGQPRWIFDLGQNMVGWVRLKARGPAGTTITMRFGEVLNSDGTLYTANLRSARQTDYYTFKGEGEEVYEPHFTFHGFRYVEVSGCAEPPTRDMLTGVVIHSATPPSGTFECSDPLLNQLQHNIEWGQKGNFVDVPTDCPQRDERLGWMGDAQVFIRTACFNADVASFFSKWLRDVEDAQSTAGAYPPVVPYTGIDMPDGGPAWADAGVICPWTIYQCYGDTRIIEERYDSMARFIAYLEATSRDLIRVHPDVDAWGGFGDWLAQDGTGKTDGGTPKDLIGTAFFVYSARLMAQMARAIARDKDGDHYDALADRVRAAFQARFVTAEGLIIGGTQTCYVLALHFDLLPPELRPTAVAALVRDIERRGMHLSTGFVGTPYLAEVLTNNGQLDVAYALLKQTSWPSWLYSVTQGATTIWERWDGWTHDRGFQDIGMNSFNHYAYGAIGAWMYATIAGIDTDPAQPGYKRIVMRPRPGGDLASASAEYQSVHGPIRSAWQRDGATFDWRLSVPANTTALVYVPCASESAVREGDNKATQAAGVRFLHHEDGAAVYKVGAGVYHFTVAEE